MSWAKSCSDVNELVSCGLREWAFHVVRPFESIATKDKSPIQLEAELLPKQPLDQSGLRR
jgi:hypothetical protein